LGREEKMAKAKISGPALFMYCVIGICLITSTVCFYLYYTNINHNNQVILIGIVTFTIMYHFWVRIIMGNVSKLFKKHINYKQAFFKERKFEKGLYKILRVKDWKGKALTYNPESFSLKEHSLKEIANTMTKSEVDHWINEIISLTSILFSIIWPDLFWAFLISAIAAMIFDSQFIIIQRYNRPRVLKILEKEKKKVEATV
jgi:hypothetical protein